MIVSLIILVLCNVSKRISNKKYITQFRSFSIKCSYSQSESTFYWGFFSQPKAIEKLWKWKKRLARKKAR